MSPVILITHAVLVGLTPLIPIPLLDDFVRSLFYRNLIQALAQTHGLQLSPDEVAALAEERSRSCLSGCLFGPVEYLVKRLIRKLIFVLEWRRAVDLVTHTYYVGHLLDHAFRQGWYVPGDARRAAQLRHAVEVARLGANTNLVRQVVRSGFDQSRQLVLAAVQRLADGVRGGSLPRGRAWLRRNIAVRLRRRAPGLARRLYRLWHPSAAEAAQMAAAEDTVAEAVARETPSLNAALGELISRLQEGLTALPQDHFEALEGRLRDGLRAAGDPTPGRPT
jgi:hypothetical protein